MSDVMIKGLFDLVSIIISAVLGYLLAQRAKAKQVDTSIQAGVRMLLYDRIKHLGKKYVARGYVTLEELEDLHSMHKIYHDDLAGNGFLADLMKTVSQLPHKENWNEKPNE